MLLEVSWAAYYAHRAATPLSRQRADEELTERIRQAHQASKGRYGAPRIHAELVDAAIGTGESAWPG